MVSSPVVQVPSSSLDHAGLSVSTATPSLADPRVGTVYDPTVFAAAAPIWFHPLRDGRHLMLNARSWSAATPVGGIPGGYSDYAEDLTPTWTIVDGPTGNRSSVPGYAGGPPIKTATSARVLVGAVSQSSTNVYLLNSVQIAGLSADLLLQLSTDQVLALTTTQVSFFKTSQINTLTTTQLTGLTANQVKALTRTQVGSLIATGAAVELLNADRKEFTEEGFSVSISQVEELGLQGFAARRQELEAALRTLVITHRYDLAVLAVTDIVGHHSLVLAVGQEAILAKMPFKRLDDALFDAPGVVSRKKQLFPAVSDALHHAK